MVIRECIASDIESVCALQQRWLDEGNVLGWVPSAPEELRAAIGSYFLVVEKAGAVIGFILRSVKISDGLAVIPKGEFYLEIDDLYVEPEARNTNVGSELIENRARQANGVGHALVYSANTDVRRILKFYERHGFKSWYIQMFRKL